VLDGGVPKVSVEHARHIVEVVLASYEAAGSGQAVVLLDSPQELSAQELSAGLALTDAG
jgi:hypothetical protein